MEIEYKATPPAEELDSLGQAGKELASAPKSVSVRLSETSVRPTLCWNLR